MPDGADTVLMVSNRREASARADTVLLLDNGRTAAAGPLEDLLRESVEVRGIWASGRPQ